MLSIISYAFWPSVCHLWKNVSLGLLHIFFLFFPLSYMSFWCILEINPLLVGHFLPFCGVFVLFMVSFAMKNLLSLIRSHFFLFLFALLQVMNPKIYCCEFMSRSFRLVFLKKPYRICLDFRSFIHFAFIFVYSVREMF